MKPLPRHESRPAAAILLVVVVVVAILLFVAFQQQNHEDRPPSSTSRRSSSSAAAVVASSVGIAPSAPSVFSAPGGKNASAECASEFDRDASVEFHQVRLPKGEGGGTVPSMFLREAVLDLADVIELEALRASPSGRSLQAEQDRLLALKADVVSHHQDASVPRVRRKRGDPGLLLPPPDSAESISNTPLGDHRVWIWAADGTLLNLMRWAAVVNDNDVDASFVVLPHDVIRSEGDFLDAGRLARAAALIRGALRDKVLLRRWYVSLLFALARAGVIDRPEQRQLKNLRSPFKPVKPRRCLLRRGFAQCRHSNGLVVFDFFGPENSFVGRPGFSASSLAAASSGVERDDNPHVQQAARTLRALFFPLRQCKAYGRQLPCPAQPLAVLKSWSLDMAASSNNKKKEQQEEQQQLHHEFGGCALLTRREDEHDAAHIRSILRSAQSIEDCGFPSLWPDRDAPECRSLLKKAGV